jgi:hypothetical protein
MRSQLHRLAAGAALAAGVSVGLYGLAQGAPATAALPPGVHVVKMTNAERQAITAVYASPPGKNDWGEDLLGKQTAGAGRTVALRFRAATPDACVQDLQMLMNDGKVIEKPGVNVCDSADYRFSQ